MSIEPENNQFLKEQIETLEMKIISLEKNNKKLTKHNLSLALNEAKILEIQRIASIYSWEINVLSGRMKCSEELSKILNQERSGYPSVEDLFEVIHPDDAIAFEKFYNDSVEKETPFELIHRIILPNGEERIVNHYCKTFFVENGMPLKSMGLMQDITKLKQTEYELKNAIAEAEAANRAKSDFLANMSHELRTPLNGILGYAQILSRAPELSEKSRNGVHVIYQCGSHLLTLIEDVLNLAKIEAGKLELNPTAVHLPSLLESVVQMCEIRAQQRKLELIYEPSDRIPESVEVDEKRLRQVLINLLSNAIKFTQQGYVTLAVEVLEFTDERVAHLKFQVSDTGVGIGPDDLTKIFEAFEQVGDSQKQSEGTGLGLAISQRIVQLMGSNIQVKSEFGKGSEFFFTVELPRTADWVEQQHPLDPRDRIIGYEGDRRSILVIDDIQENRSVLQNLLEPLGFKIVTAENGRVGLEQLRTDRPDIIVTDLAMPVMDGFEFIKQVRQSEDLKACKIIVSSASVMETDRQMALEVGGDVFLAKPIDANELLKCLEQQLGLKWRIARSQATPTSCTQDTTEILLPPLEVLQCFLELVQRGKLRQLRQQLVQLCDRDEGYDGFAQSAIALTKQFNAHELETLLNNYLTQIDSHA